MQKDNPAYRPAQRLTALFYGILCHLAFAAAVIAMALSLFSGMRFGIGPFRGWSAAAANTLLLAAFPITHSWLLTPKGRRFMAKLVPLGIGAKLSWTVFATISSLQLLAAFIFWSPSGVVWWEAPIGWKTGIGIAAAGSWLLLGKSMADAQLGIQTGYIGWSSVFFNRKAEYKPFATQGLYRHVRQPIYISFALLLWLTSVWTPDQLVLAVSWTAYCVIGAALKERRFLRCFGEAFRRYQQTVPFWFPKLSKSVPQPSDNRPTDADVLIIGAGPVGLLLANLLGKRGLRVIVAERRTQPVRGSLAIGITPPSLALLRTLELDRTFEDRGIPITTAKAFEHGELLGDVDFSRLPGTHRYILSLPQTETISILRKNLNRFPQVHLFDGMEFIGQVSSPDTVRTRLKDAASGAVTEIRTTWLVGCDGHRSLVRKQAGIRFPGRNYRTRFFMADFDDRTALGTEAHLYFGPNGSVESFPLSGKRRRWIIQMPLCCNPEKSDIGQTVRQKVHDRIDVDLNSTPIHFESYFRPAHRLADTYRKGRTLLCGDAAHVMSPIGGQGMNTGFADAAHLADALAEALQYPARADQCFAEYTRVRRYAYRIAARRAARGMWMGTRTGRIWSALRRCFAQRILFRPPVREKLAPYFAMLTIPDPIKTEPAPQ